MDIETAPPTSRDTETKPKGLQHDQRWTQASPSAPQAADRRPATTPHRAAGAAPPPSGNGGGAPSASVGPLDRFDRFGAWVIRRRRRLILGWIAVVAGLAVGFSGNFSDNLTAADGTTPGSESDRVAEVLDASFGLGEREQDLIVFEAADATVDDAGFVDAVEAAIAAVESHPAVAGVGSPLGPDGAAQVSTDRHAAFAAVTVTGSPTERLT